jgi:hypothetical protein
MEGIAEHRISNLLESVKGIREHFADERQKTGKGFNIFLIAAQSERERVVCRAIADLLNPHGDHAQGSSFLRLFWQVVSPKINNAPLLDFDKAEVSMEYPTNTGRKIDIVIDDGKLFIPIEVKIKARDQPKQIPDYAAFSHKKNEHYKMPVLYLTRDGKDADNAKAEDYVCVSFAKDIINWLILCTKIETIPNKVREPTIQLLEAVKSFCEMAEEDPEMEEVFNTITKSEEVWLDTCKIKDAVNTMDDRILQLFKDPILGLVQKQIPEAEYDEDDEPDLYSIAIYNLSKPSGKYNLHINYDWRRAALWAHDKRNVRSKEGKVLSQKMSELFGANDSEEDEHAAWISGEISWPAFSNVLEDVNRYFYRLYKLYSENPQEVADKIVNIYRELEKV